MTTFSSAFFAPISCAVAVILPTGWPTTAAAQDIPQQVLILVRDNGLHPQFVDVGPGTTVVWRNEASQPVSISFTPKPVSITCRAPRGFVANAEGIDHSVTLSPGDVATLCLIDPSEYRYQVQAEQTGLPQANFEGAEDDALVTQDDASEEPEAAASMEGFVRVETR